MFDDQPIVRQGLHALLDSEPGLTVVAEAGNGLEVMLPDLNGLEVARRIRRLAPGTRALILSMHDDEPHVLEALRSRAVGYVLKGTSATSLVYGLCEAPEGRRYVSPPLSDRAINTYVLQTSEAARQVDRYELLSPRERKVIQLAAQGATNTEIAERLIISPRTAEIHRTNLLRKLALKTQTELVRYAFKRGIASLND